MKHWIKYTILIYFVGTCSAVAVEESPESYFRRTVTAWLSSRNNDWSVWNEYSKKLFEQFQVRNDRLQIVGALEEGILNIEKDVFENGEGENPQRDAALSQLYTTYAKTLTNLSARECLDLALDPHTLLIGAETVNGESTPDKHLCVENAENSLRNAATLDATNVEAENLLADITGEGTVHKRKPKEFVAELFDSFADTFDDTLLGDLKYRVPDMVGTLAKTFSLRYDAVLDAGCGTGLAGRYLRPLVAEGIIVGVDASQKMLDKAAKCTITSGCGIEKKEGDKNKPLYDALLKMDLEEMTLSNTLQKVVQNAPTAFDLIVAADVLVYFGSLEKLLEVYARLSVSGARLIFTCELATEEEAPLGWRLLVSGRFSHTKLHAIESASKVGYELVHYDEIVPRMEKGEPVRGHIFGFVLKNKHYENEL